MGSEVMHLENQTLQACLPQQIGGRLQQEHSGSSVPRGMGGFGPYEMTRLTWNSDQPCLLLCSTPKASRQQGAEVL